MIKVRRKVDFARRPDKTISVSPAVASLTPTVRVPRIARLMALAIHLDRLVRDGTVRDQSELACPLHITQPRLTQIMNLNHLAPDIQETLLFLPAAERGREQIHERALRHIAAGRNWDRQRQLWKRLQQASHSQGN